MSFSTSSPAATETPRIVPLYVGVFLAAMSALLLEVALTRVFAILMWHHFAYMIVSLALLGFGAAGSLLTALRVTERGGEPWNRLAFFSTSFGIFIILSFFLVTKIRVDAIEIVQHPINILALMTCYVILSIPFLFCGMTIGSSFSWYPQRVGVLYFFDLLGSALGGFMAPWLLGRLRTDAVILIAALIAFVSGAVLALPAGRSRRLAHALPVVLGILLVVGFTGGGLGVPALHWHIPFAPHKIFAKMYFPAGQSDTTLPSAVAQVDVSSLQEGPMRMAGDFGAQNPQEATLRGVTQDGTAPTVLYKNAGDYSAYPSLADNQASTSLLANAAKGGKAPEVLVIGVGGGPDVMMSLLYGARKVTAVEINQAMIEMVKDRYAGFLGHLFANPKVNLVHEEGRAFLKRTPDRYDVIQLSGTDTYSALASGVYSMNEGYIYTVEAVQDMYSKLKEGGYVNYSRAILTTPAKPPRETLRLANIAREALSRSGVAEPWRHIAVFQGTLWASTMIRKGEFTTTEIQALRQFAIRENFLGLVYDPLRPPGEVMDNGEEFYIRAVLPQLVPEGFQLKSDGVEPLAAALRSGLHGDRAGSDANLALAAKVTMGGSAEQIEAGLEKRRNAAVATLIPLIEYRKKVLQFYKTVLQGSAEERERFIDQYAFDLRPAWDNKPFFFDYFKLGKLKESTSLKSTFNEILPEFPVGHVVLLTSLVQIVLWAALLILLPLLVLRRQPGEASHKFRFFLYFAALGCGFMFVEISLMQRFTFFLGHPTYSLSVVLTSMLLFSGLGALASSRIEELSRSALLTLLAAVVAILLLDRLSLGWILAHAMGLGRPERVMVAVLFLAPTSFLLGFPFPLGIRMLRQRAPSLIPWGWAVNGFLSVAGSILAVMVAMASGFSVVLLLAAAIYLVALLAVPAP
jgi:hypothetical protein